MYDALFISGHIDYYRSGKPFVDSGGASELVPYGLQSIAQFVHDEGFNVKFLHIPSVIGSSTLSDVLKRYESRVVFIQCHWFVFGGGAIKIADSYKELFPDSIILLGGYHSNYYSKDILSHSSSISGIVFGEGEVVSRNIVREVMSGKGDLSNISSIHYRSSSGAINTNERKPEDDIPMHDIPIIDPSRSIFEGVNFNKTAVLNFDRGRCQNKCKYCVASSGFYSRKSSCVDTGYILRQLEIYKRCGMENIFIGECSFLHIDRFKRFLEDICESGLRFNFILETHPDLFMDDSILTGLKRVNICHFSLGLDSGSDSLLEKTGRPGSVEQFKEALMKINSIGGIAECYLIANYPNTTVAEHEENKAFIRDISEIGSSLVFVNNLVTLPGTDYFLDPNRYGISLNLQSFPDWCRFSINSKKFSSKEQLISNPAAYFSYRDDSLDYDKMIERLDSLRNEIIIHSNDFERHIVDSELSEPIKDKLLRKLKDYCRFYFMI